MLQLRVNNEHEALESLQIASFPLLIGRSPQAGLRLIAPGVFEEHARIRLVDQEDGSGQKFVIESLGSALVSVNGTVAPATRLQLGDEVSLGATRLVVSFSPAPQTGLSFHESLVWVVLLLVLLLEAVAIHLAK